MHRIAMNSRYLGLALVLSLSACGQTDKSKKQPPAKDPKASGAVMGPQAGAFSPAPSGAAKGHLGKAFTLTAFTPVKAILENPKAYVGKTVRVKGILIQHCHHRKAWFALAPGGADKRPLRVQTLPNFRVPDDVVHGKTRADAEGVVVMKTLPEQYAKHYAKEHGFFGGDPANVRGPQQIPTIRATGAKI